MSGDAWLNEVRSRLRHAFAWRGDRTDEHQYADVTGWWRQPELLRDLGPARQTTPPDYRDRHLTLGLRKSLLTAGDTVLVVDDWIDTGGQAQGAYQLTQQAQATWLGVATVIDALRGNEVRRRLNVRSLLHVRDL